MGINIPAGYQPQTTKKQQCRLYGNRSSVFYIIFHAHPYLTSNPLTRWSIRHRSLADSTDFYISSKRNHLEKIPGFVFIWFPGSDEAGHWEQTVTI